MSTLLSRPLLIDQDDHVLEIPDGRLENVDCPMVPHPLSSVALQATLGLRVSHLFQKMATENSLQLALEIEDALEGWMGTFPAALRDHRPDTRWDAKYPYVPFMRSQVSVIAYCYLLAPLKPYLLGNADPEIMSSPLGAELRAKGVDTCLDLMRASERFYDLIFPQSIKYFFIIFFMFDAATVMCSAIVHDADRTLPKRSQCVRSLRTAQELMDAVAHLSESARLSAQLLRKLAATLPLSPAEKQTLGVGEGLAASAGGGSSGSSSKKIKTNGSPDLLGSEITTTSSSSSGPEYNLHTSTSNKPGAMMGGPVTLTASRTNSIPSAVVSAPYGGALPPSFAGAAQHSYTTTSAAAAAIPMAHITEPGGAGAIWGFVDYGPAPTTTTTTSTTMPEGLGGEYVGGSSGVHGGLGGSVSQAMAPAQLGDPLTGTYLDPLWDWDRLNMDLSQYSMPQYGL